MLMSPISEINPSSLSTSIEKIVKEFRPQHSKKKTEWTELTCFEFCTIIFIDIGEAEILGKRCVFALFEKWVALELVHNWSIVGKSSAQRYAKLIARKMRYTHPHPPFHTQFGEFMKMIR